MTQMSPGQARIADPVLSSHARAYKQGNLVAQALFPLAQVGAYAGKCIQFGREGFKLYLTRRAPGTQVATVTFGYSGDPYAIVPSALRAVVPQELQQDASQVPGIDLAAPAVDVVMSALHLEHEYTAAQLARNPAKYATGHKHELTGTDRWWVATSDPTADIMIAKNAVRASIGMRPNTVVLSDSAFCACQVNAKILDRIKYTGRDSVTPEILATLWGVKRVVVGEAVVASGGEDDESVGDVWGHDVIVAYVNPGTGAGNAYSNALPSYGYTYLIKGHPMVQQPWFDKNILSWVYGTSYDNAPQLTSMQAGYLIQGAGDQS